MNSPLRIDFACPRPATGMAGVAAFLLAAGACGAAFLHYRSLAEEVAELARQDQAARRNLERLKKRPEAQNRPALPPHVIASVNRAITQLNLPWKDLFEIFESAALPGIALLSLEPESGKSLLRITAEAKDPEEMAKFLEKLAAEPRLTEVLPSRHEINEKDPNRPIRFVLEARWRKEP